MSDEASVTMHPGTQGYDRKVDLFLERSRAIDFDTLCRPFAAYLPPVPARVLDVGAGAGQNAAALARQGHDVTAVEPLPAFLEDARRTYATLDITWIADALPGLATLEAHTSRFDFVLAYAVWHHLDGGERRAALERIAELLCDGGRCALALRNGPAGLGTRVFPIDVAQTVADARERQLHLLHLVEDQPSLLPGKAEVRWAHAILEKQRGG